jgi:hypothetical protein
MKECTVSRDVLVQFSTLRIFLTNNEEEWALNLSILLKGSRKVVEKF